MLLGVPLVFLLSALFFFTFMGSFLFSDLSLSLSLSLLCLLCFFLFVFVASPQFFLLSRSWLFPSVFWVSVFLLLGVFRSSPFPVFLPLFMFRFLPLSVPGFFFFSVQFPPFFVLCDSSFFLLLTALSHLLRLYSQRMPSISTIETASKPLLQKPFLWKETKKATTDF